MTNSKLSYIIFYFYYLLLLFFAIYNKSKWRSKDDQHESLKSNDGFLSN